MYVIRPIAYGADSTQHCAHSTGRFNAQYAANKRADTLTTHSRSSVVFNAAAVRFRRKERIKYLVGLAHGRPGACVIYRDFDLAVLAELRLHRNHPARVLYRLDAIQHQVRQHLLKLHPIRQRSPSGSAKWDMMLEDVNAGPDCGS
jgi:hypothetical protein